MRIFNLILICILTTACSSNHKNPTVIKIDGMTKIDTTMRPYFINEFYLVDPVPKSTKELKSIMEGVSRSNTHEGYDHEQFIFIKQGDTTFVSSYMKDPTQGVASQDLLGSVKYKNINGKRKLLYFDIEH